MAGEQTRILPFWHSMINKGLTLVSNMFCNLNLTDMETCYKAFRTDLLKSIPIRSDRFGFEPEIVMRAPSGSSGFMKSPSATTAAPTKKARRSDGRTGSKRSA
jgi:hypothetical protein